MSKVFVNLFQLILIGGVGGDDVIGELFICRSTGLWSEESSFRDVEDNYKCGSLVRAMSSTSGR